MAKVRVLIVDDVQESRDNVERLLRFESDIEIVGKAAGGREAIEMTMSKSPTVVLMDVNMPDIDGIEATRSIMSQRPNTGVIMMSVLNEPDILRRSMLAGAREYLVKPFSLDELLSGVRNVHDMVSGLPEPTTTRPQATQETKSSSERPTGQARIISFVGSKGGVGRSFLATNFAVALREATNQRVAVVDASMAFGDIGLMMNITDAKSIGEAVQYAGSIDSELMETLMQDHASGVSVLLAPTSPQDAETVTSNIVRDALTVLVTMYDYIVVDTSPGFDDVTLQIYDVSDLLLLVTAMDMASIKDARQFLEITDLLEYEQDRVRIVLNRSNAYSGIPAHEIGESLRREIWCEFTDEAGPVLRSINEGVPIVHGVPDSKVATEIRRAVGTYLREIDPEIPGAAIESDKGKSSLVGRLRVALRSAS